MVKILLFILWAIGLLILFFTFEKIFIPNSDISKYLTSAGILISAFIASTTVLLSIENTKKIELKKDKIDKEKNFAYLSQICNTINREIDKNKNIWPNKKMRENKDLYSVYYEAHENSMISQLISSKDIFESLILKLNDKDLYTYQPIIIYLESLNKFLSEFNSISNSLFLYKKSNDNDYDYRHFFNGMQVVHILSKRIDETLKKLNTELMKIIPTIQSQSLLNKSLSLLIDDNINVPFYEKIEDLKNE